MSAPSTADAAGSPLASQSSPGGRLLSGLHLTIISLGIFLTALDQTVVVTALWPISTDLGIPVSELDRSAWVVTAYLLGYTVSLPLMGRVADVYGQRRVFVGALWLFMLGSLLCAVAPSLSWLLPARVVQAVGGGAVLPAGLAMSRSVGARRVPLLLGVLGAVAEAGGVIGPLWGGIIMQGLGGVLGIAGWRWIFWVNLPIGLVFVLLALRIPSMPRFPGKIDWPGAILLGAALLLMSLGLATPGSAGVLVGLRSASTGPSGELITPQGAALLALSVVLFVAFALWQRRTADPLLPRGLFSGRKLPFAMSNLTNGLVGSALIVTMVNVPLYVAGVLDGTTQAGGLMLLRMTAFIPVGAVLGGVLGLRVPYRLVAVAGLLVAFFGFRMMSGWTLISADLLSTWVGLGLNGLGFGLLLSPVTATALSWGGARHAAFSAASVNVSRMIGMMVSLSALTALGLRHFQTLMLQHPAVLLPDPGETAEAFAKRQGDYLLAYKGASLEVISLGFMVAGILCLLAIVPALWLRRNPESDIEPGLIV